MPQYGEYATPEQQRAAIRQPLPQAPHPAPEPERATTTAARPRRTADRVLTIALLAYGLLTVLTAIPQLLDFQGFVDAWIDVAGVDAEFTNFAQGRVWGHIGAVVFGLGWVVTALASVRALRRGRVAWWIPLVGAIVTFLIASICLSVPILGDPGIAAHFGR
ncbi:hypothetical protein AOA12_08100 [Microbacterium sp. No. 7]|nr:hypothetical protein AOA12_08100 [Microbacterium sp. No. 7]